MTPNDGAPMIRSLRTSPNKIKPLIIKFTCASYLLFFVVSAVHSLALGGPTWDELLDFEGVNGAFWHAINYLKGLNPDPSTITYDLENYGNATRWLTYLVWRLLNVFPWEASDNISREALVVSSSYFGINHVTAICYGFLGVVLTGLLAKQLADTKAALFSALLLGLLPIWLGNTWMNSKDIPFAAAYIAYTLSFTVYLTNKRSQLPLLARLSRVIRITSIALLTGSRIGSLSFLIPSEIFFLLIKRRSYLKSNFPELLGGLLFGFILTPQAWGDPVGYPFTTIKFFSHMAPSVDRMNLVAYITKQLADTVPAVLLLGIVFTLLYYLAHKKIRIRRAYMPLFLQLSIAPILLLVSSKSTYDSLRHLLFVYPPLCIIAGIGYSKLTTDFKRNLPQACVVLIATLLAILLVVDNLSLSPYQYTYRSELSHLISSSPSRDYWAFSAKETFVSCFKDDQCKRQLSSVPFALTKSTWNKDLMKAFLEQLIPARNLFEEEQKDGPYLRFATSHDKDNNCIALVSTSRRLPLRGRPHSGISRIERCEK